MYKRQLVFLLSAFHFSPSSSYLRLYLHRIRMTWQAYIDDLMSVDEQTGTIPVMDAAICGTEVVSQNSTDPTAGGNSTSNPNTTTMATGTYSSSANSTSPSGAGVSLHPGTFSFLIPVIVAASLLQRYC